MALDQPLQSFRPGVRNMEGFDRVAVKVNFGAIWCEG
jgi:hypothetical protein